jgi:hypothetical protein
MKTMSAIYQKVRHRLNDDWAYGNDLDARPWDFQVSVSSSVIKEGECDVIFYLVPAIFCSFIFGRPTSINIHYKLMALFLCSFSILCCFLKVSKFQ